MQIITSKSLPPLAPTIIKRYDEARKHGEGQLRIEAKYCPSMDLIATYPTFIGNSTGAAYSVGDDNTGGHNLYDDDDDPVAISVWRFNGQQVFTIDIEGDGYEPTRIDVIDVDWQDDGQMLVILSSDNMIRMVNTFSGKVVHKFSSVSTLPFSKSPKTSFRTSLQSKNLSERTSAAIPAKPTTLVYSTRFAQPSTVFSQLERANAENGTELDDLLGLNADIGKLLKSKANLPRELASIDVEAFLPRLACLPPAGFGVEDLFSTRNSIDSIFHASRTSLKSGMADILLAGRGDAVLHFRLFGSFEVGDIDLSTATALPKSTTCKSVLRIATHPFTDHIFVIARGIRPKQTDCLLLFDIDPRFISRSPINLPILATKATQLQNILRYLKQIQTQLAREIKTAFELPFRFLRTLNEDLVGQDGPGSSFSIVAYHTLATGQVTGVFKEWLVDILGERGIKRWEKAINDCFDLVRRLISESWGPAVERLGVVASRLAGLAACGVEGKGEWMSFGIDKKLVEALQQTIDVMAIYGEDVLREVNLESSGFANFIKWLKWEVDAAGLEDTSERLDELRESSDQNDILKVLEYIDRGLVDPTLQRYVGEVVGSRKTTADIALDYYDHFKEERKKSPQQAKLPTLGDVLLRTEAQCQKLFEQIALTLQQKTLVTYMTDLPLPVEADQPILDVRVITQPEHGSPQIHLLGLDKARGTVSYVVADTQNSPPGAASAKPINLPSPEEGCQVLDGKFVDDGNFMLLVRSKEDVRIYNHGLVGPTSSGATWQLRHTFKHGLMEAGMKPFKFVINGRKHRRAVAVTDQDGRGYSVFDLDSDESRPADDGAN